MKDDYVFYAFNVNGHTAAVFNSPEEALDELSTRLKEDDSDTYEIEPIYGIFRMIERIADFDGRYDDLWMKEVIRIACQMVFKKEELEDKAESKKDLSKKTNSKDQTQN